MRISVVREEAPGERRVAITPAGAEKLIAAGHSVAVETDCGVRAGYSDRQYESVGATIQSRSALLEEPGVVVGIEVVRNGVDSAHTVIGLVDPLWKANQAQLLAETGATVLSLELMPRITRAQSMDVLSSMATVAGYEAVLLAAATLPKMFPLMMTAAGTVPAARTLVLGAGVAGLQAIATAKRLGSVVSAYDVRPAAAEQIESVGAKSIQLDLDTTQSEDAGGYAKAQSTDQNQRQQDQLAPHVAEADIVITTAAIPGAKSPLLLTTSMVEGMKAGSVIVDLAAERGGNCELTVADQSVEHRGVMILGPTALASGSSGSASQMFSNNVVTFLGHLTAEDSTLAIDREDEITAGTLVAVDGAVVHLRVVDAIAKLRGETT